MGVTATKNIHIAKKYYDVAIRTIYMYVYFEEKKKYRTSLL